MKILIFILIFVMYVVEYSFAQQNNCDYKAEILVNNSEFEKESFVWRMRATKLEGKPTNITGTAEIQDSKGQIVKKYRPWTNEPISKQKTSSEYSPNLKEDEYKIKAEIRVECNDTYTNNNIDVRIVTIKEKDKEANKTIDQSSNQDSFIEEKTENTIKNETIIQSAVDEKHENKNPNENKTEELMPSQEDSIIQLKDSNEGKNELTAAAVQEPKIVYESSNEKAKELIIIFLLSLSILLNIILIWRR